MLLTKRNALLSLAAVFIVGGSGLATSVDDPTQGPDMAMTVQIQLEGWTGFAVLESDGDAKLLDGQLIGEWSSTQDINSTAGTILVDLVGDSSLLLTYGDTPVTGAAGLALLTVGVNSSGGSFMFEEVPTSACDGDRIETGFSLGSGTEQLSEDPNRQITRVVKVSKCGLTWYEAELADGSRHKVDDPITGDGGQSGKGTTSFDGFVSFVDWMP